MAMRWLALRPPHHDNPVHDSDHITCATVRELEGGDPINGAQEGETIS